jgi:hypothetical protein
MTAPIFGLGGIENYSYICIMKTFIKKNLPEMVTATCLITIIIFAIYITN